MRKRQFPWVVAIVLVAGFAGWHLLGLIVAAIGLFAGYLVSLRLHPRIRHTGCRGTGEVRGAIFTWVFRKCPRCNSGRLIRWGAGQWGAEHIRTERRRTAEGRARAREEHRWR